MEIIRLLNRVIDLCAQGEYQGAETVAEHAKMECEQLIMANRRMEIAIEKIRGARGRDEQRIKAMNACINIANDFTQEEVKKFMPESVQSAWRDGNEFLEYEQLKSKAKEILNFNSDDARGE